MGDATKLSSREFVIRNKDYNSVQHNGDTLSFTFLGHGTGDIDPTVQATVEGMGDCAGGTAATLAPGQTRPPATAPPKTGGSPYFLPRQVGHHTPSQDRWVTTRLPKMVSRYNTSKDG